MNALYDIRRKKHNMKLKTPQKVNYITIIEEGGHTNDKTKIGEIEHCVVM